MNRETIEKKPGFFQRFILNPIKKLFIAVYNLIVVVLVIVLVMVPIMIAGIYYSKPMDQVGKLGDVTAHTFVKDQLAGMETAVNAGFYSKDCYNKARLAGMTAAWKATLYWIKIRFPDSPPSQKVSFEYQAFPKGSEIYNTDVWQNDLDGWVIIYRYAIYDAVTNPPGNGCLFFH